MSGVSAQTSVIVGHAAARIPIVRDVLTFDAKEVAMARSRHMQFAGMRERHEARVEQRSASFPWRARPVNAEGPCFTRLAHALRYQDVTTRGRNRHMGRTTKAIVAATPFGPRNFRD